MKSRNFFYFFFLVVVILLTGYTIYNNHREKFIDKQDTVVYLDKNPGEAGGCFSAGSEAALRMITIDQEKRKPVANARFFLELRERKKGALWTGWRNPTRVGGRLGHHVARGQRKKGTGWRKELARGKTGPYGTANIRFRVPQVSAGKYEMFLKVKSPVGKDKITLPVTITGDFKILLTTDKPVYQPGQTIHIRTLFQGTRGHHVARGLAASRQEITAEVYEPKGYKVFSKELKTCEFGIAAADFTLAKEINTGAYTIRITAGKKIEEKDVAVKNYVLPKFKIRCRTEKSWYLPGQLIKGKVEAAYFFGKAVSGGQVTVKVLDGDKKGTTAARLQGSTDAAGIYDFEYRLPARTRFSSGKSSLKPLCLMITVRDKTGHGQKISHTIPITGQGIKIELLPESGIPRVGMENIIYVATAYADGSPARCGVHVNRNIHFKTNRFGIGEFRVFIKPGHSTAFDVRAQDRRGNKGRLKKDFYNGGHREKSIILRPGKSIYTVGDTSRFNVFSTEKNGPVYIDVLKDNQLILAKEFELAEGKCPVHIPLEDNMAGALTLYARVGTADEPVAADAPGDFRILWDMKKIIVQPSKNTFDLTIETDKQQYAPGEEAELHFFTGKEGKGCAAAIGVNIVDESVYGLAGEDTAIKKFHFNLERELLEPGFRRAGFTLPGLLWNEEHALPSRHKNKITTILLTSQLESFYEDRETGEIGSNLQEWFNIAYAKEDFRIVQMYIIIAIALILFIIMKRRYKRENRKLSPDFLEGTGLMFLLFYLQMIPFLVTEGDIFRTLSETWKIILFAVLAALIFLSVRFGYFKKNNFKRMFISAAAAAFFFAIMCWIYGEQNTPFVLIAAAVVVVTSMAIFLVHAIRRKDRGLILTVLLYCLFLFSLTDILGHHDYHSRPILVILSIFTICVLYIVHTIRFYREKNKIAIPLMITAVIFLVFFASLIEMSNRREHVFFSGHRYSSVYEERNNYSRPASGMHRFQIVSMWHSYDYSLLPSAPEKEPAYDPASTRGREKKSQKKEPALRQFFPETLYSNPRLITGKDGRASLKIKMADSITQWRVSGLANTIDGFMASSHYRLPVFRDFFIDIDAPETFTVGDEIRLPVAIYNYSPTPQQVTVKLLPAERSATAADKARQTIPVGFKKSSQENKILAHSNTGEYTRTARIKAKDAGVVYFPIKATKAGNGQIEVHAYSGAGSDAQRRQVTVVPAGREIRSSISDRLAGETLKTITIPPTAEPNSEKLLLKIYPGLYAQVVEGLDSLLHMPHGCFEQTSSVLYPNILTLEYMKRTGRATPEIQNKAKRYIACGYQKLLKFEVMPGGFSLFGDYDPGNILSAYALLLFTDMTKVHPIDGTLIPRIQKWLLNQFQEDSWAPDTRIGTAIWERDNRFAATGYVTYALLHSGWKKNHKTIREALAYLKKHYIYYYDNPAVMSLYALTLSEAGQDATPILEQVDKLSKEDRRGIYWDPSHNAITAIEATAMAARAYLTAGYREPDTSRIIHWLIARKGVRSHWGNTQATILTLKALMQYAGKSSQPVEGVLSVWLNDRPAGEVILTGSTRDMLHILDLSQYLSRGESQIRIRFEGIGEPLYQILSSYHKVDNQPRPGVEKKTENPLHLDLKYEKKPLKEGEILAIEVTAIYKGQRAIAYPVMDIGIPPGFTIDAGDFQKLRNKGLIKRFEIRGNRVILYLEDLGKKGIRFRFGLKATYAARVTMPASKIYDYYDPQTWHETRPGRLIIE